LFNNPEKGPYITTSLQFISGSFKYKGDGAGNLLASVEITQVFSKDGEIIIADKYLLDSPIMKDSIVDDFYDVQNYALEPGTYVYDLEIKDAISGETVTGQQEIEVKAIDPDKISLSGIEFIEDVRKSEEANNFTKSGYFMLPYLTNYFPPEINKIAFYTEIYNANKVLGENEPFILTCSVESYETGQKVNDIFKFKRLQSGKVVPSIMFVPIENLPSGDYNLMLNLINKENDTIFTEALFFQRRNDIVAQTINYEDLEIDPSFREDITYDSLPYFLGSLMPISEPYDYENIRKMLKLRDTASMENYFFSYWYETAPEDPYGEWLKYKKQVYYTEKLFGTLIKHGWETDRGRIHLKYGSPNAVADRQRDAEVPAYQIWHYYRIGQRSDVRFVFYNPSRATNDYPLLHSDMQGELQNYKWQEILNGNTNTDPSSPWGNTEERGWSNTLYNGGM